MAVVRAVVGTEASRRRPAPSVELTTVSDDGAVFHDGEEVLVHDGLEPDTEYEFHGESFRTLPRPPGERLATIATVTGA